MFTIILLFILHKDIFFRWIDKKRCSHFLSILMRNFLGVKKLKKLKKLRRWLWLLVIYWTLGGRAKHPNPIFLHLFYPLKPDFHRFKKSQQVNESTGQRVIGYRGKIGGNGF